MKKTTLLMLIIFCCHVTFAQTQIGGTISGTEDDGFFSISATISANGNRIAASATPLIDNSSYIRILEFQNDQWIQVGNIITGTIANQLGYHVQLSGDGNRLIASANQPFGGENAFCRVYELSNDTWEQVGSDIPTLGLNGDVDGPRVSITFDGNIIAFGSGSANINGSASGYAQAFEYDGTDWIQLGSDIIGPSVNANLGSDISISDDGSILAVATAGFDDVSSNGGKVTMYRYNGSDWIQLGNELIGAGPLFFGSAIDLSADGSTLVTSGGDNNGVQVFSLNDNTDTWEQVGSTIPITGFVSEVAISADGTRIIGGSTSSNGSRGQMLYFEFNNTNTWVQRGDIIEGNELGDQVGSGLGISANGEIVAIGASQFFNFVSDRLGYLEVYDYSAPLSIEDSELTNDIFLYSNPVNNQLIVGGLKSPSVATIYDINGRQLIQKEISPSQNQILVETYVKGIYLLDISQKNNTPIQSLKFIKL